jgi:hypothetical protein
MSKEVPSLFKVLTDEKTAQELKEGPALHKHSCSIK